MSSKVKPFTLKEACETVIKCCEEALDGSWDKSDPGFEDIKYMCQMALLNRESEKTALLPDSEHWWKVPCKAEVQYWPPTPEFGRELSGAYVTITPVDKDSSGGKFMLHLPFIWFKAKKGTIPDEVKDKLNKLVSNFAEFMGMEIGNVDFGKTSK